MYRTPGCTSGTTNPAPWHAAESGTLCQSRESMVNIASFISYIELLTRYKKKLKNTKQTGKSQFISMVPLNSASPSRVFPGRQQDAFHSIPSLPNGTRRGICQLTKSSILAIIPRYCSCL